MGDGRSAHEFRPVYSSEVVSTVHAMHVRLCAAGIEPNGPLVANSAAPERRPGSGSRQQVAPPGGGKPNPDPIPEENQHHGSDPPEK
jgi:hypothetical protein